MGVRGGHLAHIAPERTGCRSGGGGERPVGVGDWCVRGVKRGGAFLEGLEEGCQRCLDAHLDHVAREPALQQQKQL